MPARRRAAAVTTRAGDVVAFRLGAHHLTRRRPADALHEVAAACGVQDSPPGSALLALHARVEGVTRARFDHLVGQERSLLQTWCMRGSPFCFPTADAAVFTTGVLPPTEQARLHLVVGVEQALKSLEMRLDEIVDFTASEIGEVLAGRQLAIGPLGERLAGRVARLLTPARRSTWQATGPYRANQPLGEAVVHFCVRILTLRGIVCMAARTHSTAPFVLLEEWLGRPLPPADPGGCRAALLRRYLRCYGPSTGEGFAAWVGVRAGDVAPWWTALEQQLVPVDVDGRPTWLHADDVAALQSPTSARGVRLLPPGDPYTQVWDRDSRLSLVAARHHRQVWRSAGAPGTVLADGQIVGTWRPRKRGRALTLAVSTFRPLTTALLSKLREEAEQVAPLRGATTVHVEVDGAAG